MFLWNTASQDTSFLLKHTFFTCYFLTGFVLPNIQGTSTGAPSFMSVEGEAEQPTLENNLRVRVRHNDFFESVS